MPTPLYDARCSKRTMWLLFTLFATLLILPGASAQDDPDTYPNTSHPPKSASPRNNPSRHLRSTSNPALHLPPDTTPSAQDDQRVAALQAIDAFNTAIQKLEATGRETSDLRAHAEQLAGHLSSGDRSLSQIAAEASVATVDALGRLQIPTKGLGSPARDVSDGKPSSDPYRSQAPVTSQRQRSESLPLWLSVIALVLSIFALLRIRLLVRNEVLKVLRKAGLI
jgi:hypothetical protein